MENMTHHTGYSCHLGWVTVLVSGCFESTRVTCLEYYPKHKGSWVLWGFKTLFILTHFSLTSVNIL